MSTQQKSTWFEVYRDGMQIMVVIFLILYAVIGVLYIRDYYICRNYESWAECFTTEPEMRSR